MTLAALEYDLDLARNKQGNPLSEDTKAIIRELFIHPTLQNWDRCFPIVLAPSINGKPTISLWRAVQMVDPNFQTKIQMNSNGIRQWKRIPSLALIEQAIQLATH